MINAAKNFWGKIIKLNQRGFDGADFSKVFKNFWSIQKERVVMRGMRLLQRALKLQSIRYYGGLD
jgi:hypothetical protein